MMISTLAYSAPVLLSHETSTPLDLHRHLELFVEPSADWSVERVVREADFTPLLGHLSLGYTRADVWLRFHLRNTTSSPLLYWLQVPPAHLDQVDLYQTVTTDASALIRLVDALGDNRSWYTRTIKQRHSVFELTLAAGTETVFYLRLASTGNIAAAPTLFTPAQYLRTSSIDLLVYGGFFISALVVVLVNLLHGMLERRYVYLYYGLYVATIGLYLAAVEGVIPFILDIKTPLPLESWVSFLHAAISISAYALLAEVLQMQQLTPRLHRLCSGLMLGYFIVALVISGFGVDHHFKSTYWVITILNVSLQIVYCLYWWRRGQRQAGMFLLAFGPLMLWYLHTAFGVLGMHSVQLWSNVLSVALTFLHMVLVQFLVSETVFRRKQTLDSDRDIALDYSKSQHRYLEAEVARRTEQLSEAKHQLESALEQEKRVTTSQHYFLRMVAHEFRTPLSVIQSACDLLDMPTLEADLREKTLFRQRQSVLRLTEVINNALSYDRFEFSVWRNNAEWIDVFALMQQVMLFGQTISGGRHQFELECCEVEILADRQLLCTLFNNLVDNAVKYSPSGGTIQLKVEQNKALLLFSVCDEGVGIAPSDVPHIFNKYVRGRLEGPPQGSEPGLGLGLYLVERITLLHGGEITLDSKLDVGTCIRISLPQQNTAVNSTVMDFSNDEVGR